MGTIVDKPIPTAANEQIIIIGEGNKIAIKRPIEDIAPPYNISLESPYFNRAESPKNLPTAIAPEKENNAKGAI